MNDLVSTLIAIFLFLLIPTIGISRVYLGAHYASDVIGGWIIGGIGLIAIAVIYGLV